MSLMTMMMYGKTHPTGQQPVRPTVPPPPEIPPKRRHSREYSKRFFRNWKNAINQSEGVDHLLLIIKLIDDFNITTQRAPNSRSSETIKRRRRVFRPLFPNYSTFDTSLESFKR